jgi:hypothetical protein
LFYEGRIINGNMNHAFIDGKIPEVIIGIDEGLKLLL